MTRRIWLAMAGFFLCAFTLTVRGHYGSDQFLSYLTAESLVLDGDLAIGDRPFLLPDIETNLERAPLGADGRRYSLFGLALPLAMAPFYALGHLVAQGLPSALHDHVTMFCVSATNAVITALTCLLLVSYVLRLGYRPRTAFALALLYGFGTLAWNYAQYSFAEPLFTGAFLFSLWVLNAWERSGRTWPFAHLLGLALGLCLLTEVYAALIVVPAVGLYVLWRLRRQRAGLRAILTSAASLATGALPAVVAGLAFYRLRFGAADAIPRLSGELSLAFVPVALYGFLFSSGKSFFLYAPPALLGLAGAPAFARRFRPLALMLGAIALASAGFIAAYVDFWHGDAAWGPRFLFHLAIVSLLPAAEVLERGLRPGWAYRLGWALLLGASGFVQLGGVLVNVGRYLQMVADQRLGDPRFLPQLSPVVGHWLLVASTVSRGLTGRSLTVNYPTGRLEQPWQAVNLAPYDGFDLWFVHLPRYWQHPAAPWLALAGSLLLLTGALACLWYVRSRLFTTETTPPVLPAEHAGRTTV